MFGRKKKTGTTTTTATTTTHRPGPAVPARTSTRKPWHYPLIFILLFIFGVVELGLLAHMIHLSNKRTINYRREVQRRLKYALFVAVWTVLLSIVFLGVAMATFLFRWLHHVGFLALTTLFWLIAAALIEARVGNFDDRKDVCHSFISTHYCSEWKAIRAFAWILFALSLLSIPLVWAMRHKERQHIRDRSDPEMRGSQTALAPGATTYGHANLTPATAGTAGHHHIGHSPASHGTAGIPPATQGRHVEPVPTDGVTMHPVGRV